MNVGHPFVSIIIPTRNVGKFIGPCLDSLDKLNYPKDKYEVIVSDSESEDETPSIVQKYGAILVSIPQRSVCAGRNAGFKVAKGEIIAFSDADCVMDKNWIINCLKYFEDPKIGAVGGPNLSPSDDTPFAKAVAFIFNQAIFSAGSIHGRFLNKTMEVKSLPGCNIILRREALNKVLPLDETILGGEDYAMNYKIRQLGYRLLYTPDIFVWHYHRATPKKFFKQIYRYGISRLIIGKKDLRMINGVHVAVGLGIPILLGLSVILAVSNPLWLVLFVSIGCLFLLFYALMAFLKLKSLKTALWVPVAILILFSAWSLGFLRELINPLKK